MTQVKDEQIRRKKKKLRKHTEKDENDIVQSGRLKPQESTLWGKLEAEKQMKKEKEILERVDEAIRKRKKRND